MKEDALDRILKRNGLYEKLIRKKESIIATISHLFYALEAYHGEVDVDSEILGKLIWDVVRMDPAIIGAIFENERFDLNEIKDYGGIVSKRVVQRIIKIAKDEGLLR